MTMLQSVHCNQQPIALFREVQRFTQPWLLVPVTAVAALSWWWAAQRFLLVAPWPMPAPQTARDEDILILWIIFGVLLPGLLIGMRLRVEVDGDGISAMFIPFHRRPRRIAFSDIATIEAAPYRPLLEFGGWGIRRGIRRWAYTVRGNRGVHITLHSGAHLLIGTRQSEAFMAAVKHAATNGGTM